MSSRSSDTMNRPKIDQRVPSYSSVTALSIVKEGPARMDYNYCLCIAKHHSVLGSAGQIQRFTLKYYITKSARLRRCGSTVLGPIEDLPGRRPLTKTVQKCSYRGSRNS